MTRSLDSFGKLPLMLGANAGVFRIDYLRLARNKPPDEVYFFIVNIIKVLGTEETLFGHIFRI